MTSENRTSSPTPETPPAQRYPSTPDFPSGPAVGEVFPSVVLLDQGGSPVDLTAARAGRPALIVFHRSAQWCAFCRSQLRQLEEHHAAFEAAGVALFAISYDAVPPLAEFAGQFVITYPLLSDPGSEFIRQVGILNDLIAPEENRYGIPFPGCYALDQDGRVVAKYFFQHYRERPAPLAILREAFEVEPDLLGCATATSGEGEGRAVATLAAPVLAPYQHTPIYVRGPALTAVAVTSDHDALETGEVTRSTDAAGDVEFRVPLILRALDVESVTIEVTANAPGDASRMLTLVVPVAELTRA